MKRFHHEPWDDRIDETEPADPGVRASGVVPVAPEGGDAGERAARRPARGEGRRSPSPPLSLSAAPVAEGPCRTFEDLYRRHAGEVWAVIVRSVVVEAEAKDVFQKVFTAMLAWTRANPVVPETAGLLFTMTRHHVVDHARERERRRRRLDGEADADAMPSSKPDPEQLCGRAEARRKVEAILAQMRPQALRVFRLSEIDRCSPQEIAEILGCKPAAARVRLCRARAEFWALAERLFHMKAGDYQ